MKRFPLVVLSAAAPLLSQDPRLVVDLVPGATSSNPVILGPSGRPSELLVAMDDGVRGNELWRTDGTATGTTLVTELVPGPAGATIRSADRDGRECWFVADRGQGDELWRSDGTASGTTMAFAIGALGATSLDRPRPSLRIGSQFPMEVSGNLAITDGTPGGTHQLGFSNVTPLFVHGNSWCAVDWNSTRTYLITASTPPRTTIYFDTLPTVVAGELILLQFTYQQFPTPLTFTTLRAIERPGVPTLGPMRGYTNCFDVGGQLLFVAEGSPLLERWDFVSPPTTIATNLSAPSGLWLQRLGDRLLFIGNDATYGTEPWITDGTPAGTQVLDFAPGPASSIVGFGGEIGRTGKVLLWLDLPATGWEPWSTDGTVAGSQFLGDLEPGVAGSGVAISGFGGAVGQRRAVREIWTSSRGGELWITDGTAAGSRHLQEIQPGPADGINGSVYWLPYAAGHRLVFAADDAVHGVELWAIDLEGSTTPMLAQGSRSLDVNGDVVLGAQVEFRSNGLAPQDLGAVAVGLPASAPVSGPSSTQLLVDLATSLPYLLIAPDAQGAWSQSVTVPNDAALQGLELVAQAGFAGPSIPGGVEFGSAWWLCLGR